MWECRSLLANVPHSALAAVPGGGLLGSVDASSDYSASTLAALSFAGSTGGVVKRLRGFRKDRHTVPDAVNAATSAFFARICADDLAEEAESWFQRARSGFDYKRADLRVEFGPANALLLARDFSFERAWALNAADPAHYVVTRTLRDVRDGLFLQGEACASVFAGTFTQIVFSLSRGVAVEAVIDAVEGPGVHAGMTVSYPANCSECTVAVPGVDASVRCTGAALELVFPRAGSPRELIEGFGAVRAAFRFTGRDALAGLV